VDDELAEVVERFRRARSLPLLRLIDDAHLDRAVESEPNPTDVVQPYRWLLTRVADGVRLTQAGYLPPAVVSEAMTKLGWRDDWIGKGNREDLTIPVLELRESAQRFGLLRKNHGQLLVTKVGRGLIDDPDGLWWHLAEQLPDARSEPERHAGLLYLLTVAAGRARDDALLAQGMTVLGWAERGTWQSLSPSSAFLTARDTWAAFRRLGLLPERARWDAPDLSPSPGAMRLARAALLGRAAPATGIATPEPPRREAEQAVELTVP